MRLFEVCRLEPVKLTGVLRQPEAGRMMTNLPGVTRQAGIMQGKECVARNTVILRPLNDHGLCFECCRIDRQRRSIFRQPELLRIVLLASTH